jgi:D-alanyl-D-alanine carboxypeptidase
MFNLTLKWLLVTPAVAAVLLIASAPAGASSSGPPIAAPQTASSPNATSATMTSHLPDRADTDTDTDSGVDGGTPPGPVFPQVVGDAAIVVDRDSGEVLGAKNADLRWAPASTTKMMTALLAIEAINAGEISLYSRVVVQADVDIEPGSGDVGLAPGDNVSVRDLLYMSLVTSANDAAVALGTYVGGSRDAFIAMMNTRARELRLDNTSYVDIAGRDPEDLNNDGRLPAHENCHGNDFLEPACAHYSTVRDLAALARVALDDPLFAQIVNTDSWTPFSWLDQSSGLWPHPTLTNTNKLIRDGSADYFDGAYGVKTGTTDRAGSNLVSAAERLVCECDTDSDGYTHRDVIAVVVGSADNGTSTGDRFSDSRALLEFGLSSG